MDRLVASAVDVLIEAVSQGPWLSASGRPRRRSTVRGDRPGGAGTRARLERARRGGRRYRRTSVPRPPRAGASRGVRRAWLLDAAGTVRRDRAGEAPVDPLTPARPPARRLRHLVVIPPGLDHDPGEFAQAASTSLSSASGPAAAAAGSVAMARVAGGSRAAERGVPPHDTFRRARMPVDLDAAPSGSRRGRGGRRDVRPPSRVRRSPGSVRSPVPPGLSLRTERIGAHRRHRRPGPRRFDRARSSFEPVRPRRALPALSRSKSNGSGASAQHVARGAAEDELAQAGSARRRP